jgi:hypothetical protein
MDWLKWQRKVIREEYVEGERYEIVRGGENDQNTGRRKAASR